MLVGGSTGVFRYQPIDGKTERVLRIEPNDICLCLYKDRKGDLWAGTFLHGFYRLSHGDVENLMRSTTNLEQEPNQNVSRSLFEDRHGRFYASVSEGVGHFDPRTGKIAGMLSEKHPEAARHKGTSVVELLQNCVIFNNNIHSYVADKEFRADRTIHLRHGEKMIFGKDNNRGLVLDGYKLKAVTIGENGVTLDDILVHDAKSPDNFLHQSLAMMDGHELPLAIGVIRNVEAPAYDQEVARQVKEVTGKVPYHSLREFLLNGETWEVK